MAIKSRPPHAITRAVERYGLKNLTNADLRDWALQCAEGSGRLAYMPDGNERHIVNHAGKTLVVIYMPYLGPSDLASPHRGAGTIITVLPKEAALVGNPRSPATKFKRRIRGDRKSPKQRRSKKGY